MNIAEAIRKLHPNGIQPDEFDTLELELSVVQRLEANDNVEAELRTIKVERIPPAKVDEMLREEYESELNPFEDAPDVLVNPTNFDRNKTRALRLLRKHALSVSKLSKQLECIEQEAEDIAERLVFERKARSYIHGYKTMYTARKGRRTHVLNDEELLKLADLITNHQMTAVAIAKALEWPTIYVHDGIKQLKAAKWNVKRTTDFRLSNGERVFYSIER